MSFVVESCSVCRQMIRNWFEFTSHVENCGHMRKELKEQLEKTTKESVDRLDLKNIESKHKFATMMVSALCMPKGSVGAREWVMSIPARPTYDPDLVISDSLGDIPKLISIVEALRVEREELMEYKHACREMLAVFHRDGGHYLDEHGIEKSYKDAIELRNKMLMDIDELKSQLAEAVKERDDLKISLKAELDENAELANDNLELTEKLIDSGKGIKKLEAELTATQKKLEAGKKLSEWARSQESVPPEFQKIIDDNFWDLMA